MRDSLPSPSFADRILYGGVCYQVICHCCGQSHLHRDTVTFPILHPPPLLSKEQSPLKVSQGHILTPMARPETISPSFLSTPPPFDSSSQHPIYAPPVHTIKYREWAESAPHHIARPASFEGLSQWATSPSFKGNQAAVGPLYGFTRCKGEREEDSF